MAKLDNLIKEYLNGNQSSFESIYEETKRSVYLSIYMIVKDKTTIEDLMQDTYLKAIENITSFKIGTNFNAWISKIAHNTAINYYNKNARIDVVEEIYEGVDNSTHLIDLALSTLEGREKQIFIYHIVLGYKFKDIASILDMNLKTAFYEYKKAINKIKENL